MESDKKIILMKIEEEILEIQNDIYHIKSVNLKKRFLKKLKISLRTFQLLYPYLFTLGIITSTFRLIGATPFIFDERKKELEQKKSFDSLGNVRIETQYENYNHDYNTITYFSKWKLENDGFYARNVITYDARDVIFDEEFINIVGNMISVPDNDYDALIENITHYLLINKVKILDDLSDIKHKKVEKRNNLKESELLAPAYLEVTVYSTIDDDIIIMKEPVDENVLLTIFYFIEICLSECVISIFRYRYSSFNYKECLNEIRKKYSQIDKCELERKLEIRLNNYKRLVR